MTTYDILLDVIIKRMDELEIRNDKLSNMVFVYYNTFCDYIDGRKMMPADVLFACLSALGIKFDYKIIEVSL